LNRGRDLNNAGVVVIRDSKTSLLLAAAEGGVVRHNQNSCKGASMSFSALNSYNPFGRSLDCLCELLSLLFLFFQLNSPTYTSW